MLKEIKSNRILLLILVVAALLRGYGLTAFSLSNDELSALSRLQFDSFGEVISQGVVPDFHPAGVQTFLYLWTGIFGFGEWIVRLPFALMGIVSVYLIYLLGRSWFSEGTGLMAAAALAVLEYPLLYSQIARPYSPGLMVSLFAAWYWTRFLFSKQDSNKLLRTNLIGFALFVSACMYTHYFSFIFAGILCFSGLFFIRKETFWPYITGGIIIVLLYIPHISIFLEQLSRGGIGGPDGWLSPPESDVFSKYLDYVFNDSSTLKMLFFIVFTGTFLLFRKEVQFSKFHVLSLLFFLAPFALAYFYSLYVNPVFQYSVMIFSFPYLLLFLFSMISPKAGKGTVTFLVFIILTGGFYSTVAEKHYYTTAHFTEFRKLAQRTIELNSKLGAENITRTTNVFGPYYIDYYHQQFGSPADYAVTRILSSDEKKRFYEVIEQAPTNWFLYSFSNMYDPPEFDLAIRSKFPYLAFRDSMMGSGLKLYSKAPVDSAINILPVKVIRNEFESGQWNGESVFLDSSVVYSGKQAALVRNDMEYGPTFEQQLFQIAAGPGSRIEISSAFYSDNSLDGVKLVISIEESGKSLIWQGQEVGQFMLKKGSWFRAFTVIELPQNLSGKEHIKIYAWNEKRQQFRMDDVTISVYSK